MIEPRAIETTYRGHRFRSRLEARWAVVFDTLGLPWEYEVQGYEHNGVRYLPDFIVGDAVGVEVKGNLETLDLDKLKLGARALGALLVLGTIPQGPRTVVAWPLLLAHRGSVRLSWVYLVTPQESGQWFCAVPHYGTHPSRAGLRLWNHGPVWDAYDAGRQARFEYGENGAPGPSPAVRAANAANTVRQRRNGYKGACTHHHGRGCWTEAGCSKGWGAE